MKAYERKNDIWYLSKSGKNSYYNAYKNQEDVWSKNTITHRWRLKDAGNNNWKYIINLNYIQDMISYTNSRLKVVLKTKTDDDIIVSREKVKSFRNWLEG